MKPFDDLLMYFILDMLSYTSYYMAETLIFTQQSNFTASPHHGYLKNAFF